MGVKVVIAEIFERIHRSNLIGMGVIPLQFASGITRKTLELDGSEVIDIPDLNDNVKPGQLVKVVVNFSDGKRETIEAKCRLDTATEVEYFRNGGILHYVLRQMMNE